MLEATHLLAFAGTALLVLVAPGPAILFLVARSLHLGRGAGLVSAVGLTAGAAVHAIATAVGLSALIATSIAWFTAIQLLGAGYLIYLGIRAWRTADAPLEMARPEPRSNGRNFLDGFLVNVFNPKLSLFFLAFLPQFVRPDAGGVQTQLLVLGSVFVLLALLVDGTYALVAGTLQPWFTRSRGAVRRQRRVSALIYVGLGVAAALTGRKATS
ncbi:MAG: RhtB family transporter [Gemmatimonadota bacterium]|nr:MAG: RhtB family transporter [Gemmatimonadota bacterium]